ncbi:MAG: glycosyltransferase family 4 protein [Candidatus Sumerlaeaceae bacterium]
MRILYISGDLGIEVGGRKGASTHIRETCRQLARRGHEVLLVTPCLGQCEPQNFEVVTIEPLRAKWLGVDLRYVLLDKKIGRLLSQLIRQFRPDAVYERYALYQQAGQRLCSVSGLPRILEVNSILSEEMKHRLRFPGWAAHAERNIWARERAIICVSQLLRERICQQVKLLGGAIEHIIVSPVGVDPEQFHSAVPPADWRKFGIHGKRIVGYTGTLTRWHGIDLLFDAAAVARDRCLPICFVVVGGEPEKVSSLRRKAWELGVGDQLRFLGSVPHEEIPSLLAGMEVCIIPDTQDWSSPTKYFEMAATARPVVAASVPAITEAVGGDGVGALLFERGNARDMIEKLQRVLNDPLLASQLGERARERVLRHYSWDCNIARILKLYAELGVALRDQDHQLIAQCSGGNSQ